MNTRIAKGGAQASPDRLSKTDWFGLALFSAPVVVALTHYLAGVLQ